MPTKTKTQPETATIHINPVPAAAPIRTHNPERYAEFVEAERDAVNLRLKRHFDNMLEVGLAEEKNFLIEVLDWWDSGYGHSGVKAYGEHEIPLFSAISDRLNGMHLIPVEDEGMVREVEEFITSKLEAGWKAPKRRSWAPESDEAIKARLRVLVCRQVQFFSMRCKRQDLIFLIDLLEQWESLVGDKEFWQNTEKPLAAAAELQLVVSKRNDKERAENARYLASHAEVS